MRNWRWPEDELLRTVRVRKPDCFFVYTEDCARIEALITGMDNLIPGVSIVVSGRQADTQLMLNLMRLWARDYLTPPITPARLAEGSSLDFGSFTSRRLECVKAVRPNPLLAAPTTVKWS
jgi:hypothetical protein